MQFDGDVADDCTVTPEAIAGDRPSAIIERGQNREPVRRCSRRRHRPGARQARAASVAGPEAGTLPKLAGTGAYRLFAFAAAFDLSQSDNRQYRLPFRGKS
ncbi:hypothetical protein ASD14_02235 [Lysobacter sp. Root494]|nr:hypothetical protein ASD14_02235 [Lysobacter sp. Root494]